MNCIILSSKYQIVIPRDIRESLALQPGQKLQAVCYNNRVELIPVWPIKRARGFLAGVDMQVERDADRL